MQIYPPIGPKELMVLYTLNLIMEVIASTVFCLGNVGLHMKELGILVNWPLIDFKSAPEIVYCFTRMLFLLLFLLKIIQH